MSTWNESSEATRPSFVSPPINDETNDEKGATAVVEGEGGRVLVIDDDQTTCEFLEATLGKQHQVAWETSGQRALDRVSHEDFDVILTDLNMVDIDGLELCERMMTLRPDIPVILVTGHGSLDNAVGAIRAGAYDFISKPIDSKLIGLTVDRALRHRRLGEEVKRLRKSIERPGVAGMIGSSVAIQRVFDLLSRMRDSDATVLIMGESGTGKELVARAIHDQSSRKDGPFLAINCAAMPSSLLESELFGHVRGAFTDAKTTRNGLFVEARGGTIFLDELGELPLDVQPKLLRALQEHKVRPVGSNQEIPFDARIVTATNRDLETDVADKRFREDLFYRINVVTMSVPPLRERGSDVLLLAQHFVEQLAARAGKQVKGIAPSAAEKLCAYDWPGNVRELQNCMERAVALMRFDSVVVDDLPEKIRSYKADRLVLSADDPSELVTVAELERRYTQRVLALVGGNKSRAARILGFDRRTLYRKMERETSADKKTLPLTGGPES
jgi:two-component system response regulator HydG